MEHSEKARKINVNRTLFIVLGIALPILSFLIFWLGVNFSSFILAFRRSSTGEWTMDNFAQFWDELTRDGGQIGIAVRNTSIYFAKDLVMLFVNLLLAFFLYKKLFMYKAFRIVFYLPAIISGDDHGIRRVYQTARSARVNREIVGRRDSRSRIIRAIVNGDDYNRNLLYLDGLYGNAYVSRLARTDSC